MMPTVGSHWVWVSQPATGTSLGKPFVGRVFVIDSINRIHKTFRYTYVDRTPGACRLLSQLELARPAKCAETCTPSTPCQGYSCPSLREDEVMASDWFIHQGKYSPQWAPSHPPTLRCGRDLACGLFRVI